jgi:hypothetical protein
VGNDPTMVTMRERVRVVKTDLDNPEKPPEVIEQETVTKISIDDAAILGFQAGAGFAMDEYTAASLSEDSDGLPAPTEGTSADMGDRA